MPLQPRTFPITFPCKEGPPSTTRVSVDGKEQDYELHHTECLQEVEEWKNKLLERTMKALNERFPEDPIIIAASLFDRRTWSEFDVKDVDTKLRVIREAFPITQLLSVFYSLSSMVPLIAPMVTAELFTIQAKKTLAMVDFLRSSSGRVQLADCCHVWTTMIKKSEMLIHPVVKMGMLLCSVPLSQAGTERLNQTCFLHTKKTGLASIAF